MAIRTELNLRLPNSPGVLAGICRALADERVTVLALSLEAGRLRLVVDNHVRGAAVLERLHLTVSCRDVLVVAVPNSPGSVASVLTLVARAGVNVEYTYGAALEGAAAGSVVLGVDDAARAATASGL